MNEHEFQNYAYVVENSAMLDTLTALVEQGPLDDGDVPSKIGRDELIALGLASRTLVKGEDGFTGATYRGRDLYCFYFGNSSTVQEAKAVRLTRRTWHNMKSPEKD